MDYFRRFTFLFAAPVFDSEDLEGLRFNQIVTEIERWSAPCASAPA